MEARNTMLGRGSRALSVPWTAGGRPRLPRLVRPRRRLLAAALALTAVVALAVATLPGGRKSAKPAVTSAAPPARVSATLAPRESVVFIVGSQEQAAQVRSVVLHLQDVMDIDVPAQVDNEFIIAGDDAARATALQSVRDVNDIRAGMGLPPYAVVDLTR
jgi:hypothetical protein